MSATRRDLFGGATVLTAAMALPAACPAAVAFSRYQAAIDKFNARRNVTDQEVEDHLDRIAPLRQAVWDAPCNTRDAAIAKLKCIGLHWEAGDLAGSQDETAFFQVLRWLETN